MYAYIHGSFCVEKLGFLGKEKDRKTSLRSREINLLRRLRRQLPYGASSNTLKPRYARESPKP